jgi:predicted  nucleic acid-binding Zn-ribbon protein
LEGLEQKGEIITNYLQKIEELEREKERLKNENNAKQQELTQKDNEVTDLKKKTKNLEIVINDLREDLEKEQN